jgi:DedD protein
VPDPGQVPVAPPPDLPPAEAEKTRADPEKPKAESAAQKSEKRPAQEAPKAPEKAKPTHSEARSAATEAKAADLAKSKGVRILLQAAALSTDAAAQDLSERLRKAGFAPFTEKVDTADGVRFRVRIGPYTTRDEAQRAQARLRAIGVSATLVPT